MAVSSELGHGQCIDAVVLCMSADEFHEGVTSGVNFTENQRFEIHCFLAIVAPPRLHAGALSPDRGRGEMPANVALGGRAWSGGNPL